MNGIRAKADPRIDEAILSLLSELARYLVEAGVSNPQFESISRLAFFQAAANQAKFSNGRVNQSAVAAMTGLTRAQVRAFERQEKPRPDRKLGRLDQLIDGWLTDPRFLGSESLPRKLSLAGRGISFPALVRKYGSDVPARSLLRELQRKGHVTIRDGYVELRKGTREGFHVERARRVAETVGALLRKSGKERSSVPPLRTINLEISFPTASPKGQFRVQTLMSDRLKEFSTGIVAAGQAAAMDSPPEPSKTGRVTRIRIAVISEDEQLRKSRS